MHYNKLLLLLLSLLLLLLLLSYSAKAINCLLRSAGKDLGIANNLKSWMYQKTQGSCPSKVATVASCPGHEYEHELYEKIH